LFLARAPTTALFWWQPPGSIHQKIFRKSAIIKPATELHSLTLPARGMGLSFAIAAVKLQGLGYDKKAARLEWQNRVGIMVCPVAILTGQNEQHYRNAPDLA
jgi:hypothetical protein